MKWLSTILLLGILLSFSWGQDATRTRIAKGEYAVSTEDDLGVGSMETEIFHFRESWTLWKIGDGTFEVDGVRSFEAPRGVPHEEDFWAQLTRDLRPVKVKEFTPLQWVRDSGPLSCDLLPNELRCDSGGKDPAHRVNVKLAMARPYGIIWPISVFSMGSLAFLAAEHEREPVAIDLVTLNQFSKALPVFTILSSGSIRFLGKSELKYEISGTSWKPRVFELTSGRTRKLNIWTSPEGLVLVIERADWPKTRLQLVSFEQFTEFPRGK